MSLLGIQSILTDFALFLPSAMLLGNPTKFQRHGTPLKMCSACVVVYPWSQASKWAAHLLVENETPHHTPPKLLGVLILN